MAKSGARRKPFATPHLVFSVMSDNRKTYSQPLVALATDETPLQSGVLTSPADGMLRQAITETLKAPASERAELFERWVCEIETFMAAHPAERPWTCTVYTGTDGSRIFRGGVGHSLVIDPSGRLWRARSYEDFDTTYAFTDNSCEIDCLTPLYATMREYLQQSTSSA